MQDYNPLLPRRSGRSSDDSATLVEYPSTPQKYSRSIDIAGRGLLQITTPLWTALDAAEAQDRAIRLQIATLLDLVMDPDTVRGSPQPKPILDSATTSRRDSGIDGPPKPEPLAPFTRDSTTSSLAEEGESTTPTTGARVPASRRRQTSKRRPRDFSRSSRIRDDLTIDGEGIDPSHESDRHEYRDAKGKWYEVPGLAAGEVPYWAVDSRVVRIRNSTRR